MFVIKNKYKKLIILCGLLLLCLGSVPAVAYDTAPRISDREIIESLAELKQGYKSLNQRLDDMNKSVNRRFDALDQRLDEMTRSTDKKFDEMTRSTNQKFDEMNANFNQRFEQMHSMILALFSSVMALVIAMIGYMIWDRKTSQQPFRRRLIIWKTNFPQWNPNLI